MAHTYGAGLLLVPATWCLLWSKQLWVQITRNGLEMSCQDFFFPASLSP